MQCEQTHKKLLEKANSDAQADCDTISATAEKNRPAVVKKAAEALLQ